MASLRSWWRWRRTVRARRREEFRLFRLWEVSREPEDYKAWKDLQTENHVIGVWDGR